jgi:uncharacterized protein
MRLDRFTAVDEFLRVTRDFLADREAEHNLILGISSGLLRSPDAYDGPPFLAAVFEADRILMAAIRTPPYNLILSEVDDPAALPLLVDELAVAGGELPGVVGPPSAVAAFADSWTAAAGGRWQVAIEERIYRLSDVRQPAAAPGGPRLAVSADRDLLERWLLAFGIEALGDEDAERVRFGLDDWARGAERRYWLWEVDGRPVSLVGAGGETPNGIRIGPVYTPPDARGNGFASNLTASVSRSLLEEGRRYCFLYTNLANSTANKIYQAIGYEPVTDALMVSFVR